MNLRSSGRGTIGIYMFSRWSVHYCLVCTLWNVLELSRALRLLPTKTKRGRVNPPPVLSLLDPQSKQPL
jgi:hypothetical protein